MKEVIENDIIIELIYSIGHLTNMNEHLSKLLPNVENRDIINTIIDGNRIKRSELGRQLKLQYNINDTVFNGIWCYIKHLCSLYIHNIELIEKYNYLLRYDESKKVSDMNLDLLSTINTIILSNVKEACSECKNDLEVKNA